MRDVTMRQEYIEAINKMMETTADLLLLDLILKLLKRSERCEA